MDKVIKRLKNMIDKDNIIECYPILKEHISRYGDDDLFIDIIEIITERSRNLVDHPYVLQFLNATNIIGIDYYGDEFGLIFKIFDETRFVIYFDKLTKDSYENSMSIIFNKLRALKKSIPDCTYLYKKIMRYRKYYNLPIDYSIE